MHQSNFVYNIRDTIVCPDKSFEMSASLPDTFTYSWSDSSQLNNSTLLKPTATVSGNTLFYITITDDHACSISDSLNVTTDIALCPITSIYIPTAFSPNNDGLNDIFMVRGAETHNFNLNIYDRLGNLVFSSIDQNEAWDGDINGKNGNSAVYIYSLKYQDVDGKDHHLKGNISLIR
jgi:gliding motility-associated-like protein